MSLKEKQDPPVISPRGPAGVTSRAKATRAGRPSNRGPVWLRVTKWGLIGLTLVVLAIVVQKLIEQGSWVGVVIAAFVAMCVLAVYGTGRAVPMKYLLPGLALLVGLQIWPIAYTVATSFTNLGDGHLISKQESIDSITPTRSVRFPTLPGTGCRLPSDKGGTPPRVRLSTCSPSPPARLCWATRPG